VRGARIDVPTGKASFIRQYLKAIEEGNAALFVGAGLSRSAGFVDWRALLSDIVVELKLDPNTDDLVAAAQYHVNEHGSRGRLNQLLIDEFTKGTHPTRNHQLLASLPLDTIWTTNYDHLLEDAFRNEHKSVDVKHRQDQLAYTTPGRDVTLFKMHGDADSPSEAVLVKEDYETYHQTRRLFSYRLQGDLVSRTFLFIGFSFTDPNINYVLARIRGLMDENVRTHFCFMRKHPKPKSAKGKVKADYEYASRRQELLIRDLKRYGIQVVLVDEYSEITEVLETLNRLVYRKNIFVSGSAHDYSPLGATRVESICRSIGTVVVENGHNLTSGFGLGIGGWVILGAMEALYSRPGVRTGDRLTLRPFPQAAPRGMSRPELWERYRTDMLSRAGSVVFISGNKSDGRGGVAVADGCVREFEIAEKIGLAPIPIGATGHAAAQLWQRVHDHVEDYYPKDPRRARVHLAVLNDPGSTDADLVASVFGLVDLAGGTL
jgi:hypothetical protein